MKALLILGVMVTSLVLLGAGCASSTAPTSPPVSPASVSPTVNPPVKEQPASQNLPTAEKTVPTQADSVNAIIAGFSFQPRSLIVAAGATVIWTNNDSAPHTVTAYDGSFDSGIIVPGATFKHTFSSPGNVSYYCTLHPSMYGIVVTR